jgi:hypothetical protein
MDDPNALLDAFTMLLAYMGDEGAKDGYLTGITNGVPTYSVDLRPHPLEMAEIQTIVQQVLNFIKSDVPMELQHEDILEKVIHLKQLVNEKNQSMKDELFTYMTEMLE